MYDEYGTCPTCLDPIEYCLGHGAVFDHDGFYLHDEEVDMFLIEDRITGSSAHVVDQFHLEAVLQQWFPDAPEDIVTAAERLSRIVWWPVTAPGEIEDLENFLQVTITPA